MPKSISFRRLPAPNPIFWDYVDNFDKLRRFYNIDYQQPIEKWVSTAELTNSVKEDLVKGLLASAERWGSGAHVIDNIHKLSQPETLAVVTGQQAGLFGGPLFTYYKATGAVLWAKEIERVTGRPTVPVFWMETSDHDFYEINHIRLLDKEGEEITLSLTTPPKEKRRVVGSIAFNGEIEQLVHRLWNLLPANTNRGPLLEEIGSIYKPGETVGDAFARLLNAQFADDGLIVFDAECAQCKKAAIPLIDKILATSTDLNKKLTEITEGVQACGYPPQIQPQEDRLQLFAKVGDVRIPIDERGTLLFEDQQPDKVGIEELRRRAQEHPEQFLPKVSLRPIMQDYLFPTAAYIAGPSEIAYFAQLKPLYESLDVTMPAIIPRISITLIETRIKRILDKYHFTPEELKDGSQKLIRDHLENDPTNDLVSLFAQARKKWEEIDNDLSLGLMRIDPTLQHPLEKAVQRWQQGLNVLEEKARDALNRKNITTVNQIKKCCMHLLPGGHFQERRFSLLYYLVHHGSGLAEQIRSQVDIKLYRHQLVYLEKGAGQVSR
ncbi:bacillithiol biosynthesis cysteine-adding enzyme BshC [candidate division LCP-89 bacterium B3_LCP]|uniref:Putative cysteine ligase BshC n=1 Tax=candidate division LCP-89 bacterium B3_LCP TaxID=2012998 RepID=A0A532UYW9_UNCL8|nr:MAG: bacillithiol biosynthesis cysteine-adding enzyme BshC [candidate division LCP-89 bacterium B3_LCP]